MPHACLVVGLFDNKGMLVDYVIGEQSIKENSEIQLSGKLKLPNAKEYVIKAFVWDSINGMKALSNVIEIPVK